MFYVLSVTNEVQAFDVRPWTIAADSMLFCNRAEFRQFSKVESQERLECIAKTLCGLEPEAKFYRNKVGDAIWAAITATAVTRATSVTQAKAAAAVVDDSDVLPDESSDLSPTEEATLEELITELVELPEGAVDGDQCDNEGDPVSEEDAMATITYHDERSSEEQEMSTAASAPKKRRKRTPKARTSEAAPTAKKRTSKPAAAKKQVKAKSAKPAKVARTGRNSGEGGKREDVIRLLGRANGVTVAQLMEKFGWRRHSCRGYLSTLKSKHGVKITTSKNSAKETVYSAA